ncbi:heavy-metal-associated domain-containing protein [Hydrogenophaga sp.]|uniref:heavy-metal-associated domain-containing protein n=2 Tax=Hydrogenophaga sp. TaxID=1904254 RepID=UPI002720883A|nr:heavy metal-associated domain-containing protein [Hydrogenophaga sp.]MDO9506046.1 heavy metal-associated domain-containing protein [Hydrogenophaga sp.]MDP3108562.1 heavy metal-associated domain-containing protein [Hydrogenophaga sp.]MDP3347817.1 heavy metal-associated domain-containing protein [Hydrogenophaga sp.]
MNAIDLDVQGMTCGACVQRVTAALVPINGVHDVTVDLRAGRVRVTAEARVAPSQLISALAARRYESVVVTNGAPPGRATDSPPPAVAPMGGCCCS